jgi:hypothetical protein
MISKKVKKYFKGRNVGVITKTIRGTSSNGTESFTGNQVFEGVWADDDRCFIFLANPQMVIIDAIHKRDITRIFIPEAFGAVVDDLEFN